MVPPGQRGLGSPRGVQAHPDRARPEQDSSNILRVRRWYTSTVPGQDSDSLLGFREYCRGQACDGRVCIQSGSARPRALLRKARGGGGGLKNSSTYVMSPGRALDGPVARVRSDAAEPRRGAPTSGRLAPWPSPAQRLPPSHRCLPRGGVSGWAVYGY